MNAASEPKLRLEWLQGLRGVAAVMVVLCHVRAWFETSPAPLPHFFRAGESGVDVFFVISGFIMVFITPEPLRHLRDWAAFLYRRFTRIFPPYWIVCAALYFGWRRHPDWFSANPGHAIDAVRSFLLLPQAQTPLVAVGWSLIHEIYFYLVVSLLFILAARGRKQATAIWFAALLALDCAGATTWCQHSPALQIITSPFSLEFQCGMLAAFTWRALAAVRLPAWCWPALAVTALAGLYIAGQFIPLTGLYPDNNRLFRLAYYGLPALLLVVATVQTDAGRRAAPKAAALLGDASYAVYLLHLPVIAMLYPVCARLPGYAGPAAAGLAALAAGILFHLLVEKRLMNFFHQHSPFRRSRA
jgi:exopolysaccharide production protein ExoZ